MVGEGGIRQSVPIATELGKLASGRLGMMVVMMVMVPMTMVIIMMMLGNLTWDKVGKSGNRSLASQFGRHGNK